MTPVMLQKQNLAKPARCSIVDWQVPTRDLDYTLWNPRLCIMFKECPLECSIISPLPPTQLVGTKKWLIERYEIVCDVTAHVTQRSCLKQWILKNGKAGPKQLVLSIWNHRGDKFPLPPVIIRHYFVRCRRNNMWMKILSHAPCSWSFFVSPSVWQYVYSSWFKYFTPPQPIEAVTQRCSEKFSKIHQENICARVSFLIKLQASAWHRRFPMNFTKL